MFADCTPLRLAISAKELRHCGTGAGMAVALRMALGDEGLRRWHSQAPSPKGRSVIIVHFRRRVRE